MQCRVVLVSCSWLSRSFGGVGVEVGRRGERGVGGLAGAKALPPPVCPGLLAALGCCSPMPAPLRLWCCAWRRDSCTSAAVTCAALNWCPTCRHALRSPHTVPAMWMRCMMLAGRWLGFVAGAAAVGWAEPPPAAGRRAAAPARLQPPRVVVSQCWGPECGAMARAPHLDTGGRAPLPPPAKPPPPARTPRGAALPSRAAPAWCMACSLRLCLHAFVFVRGVRACRHVKARVNWPQPFSFGAQHDEQPTQCQPLGARYGVRRRGGAHTLHGPRAAWGPRTQRAACRTHVP